MCRLFETIRIENGIPLNPEWHENRMNRSRKELWDIRNPVRLNEYIRLPEEMKTGLIRCNVSYGREVHEITFREYRKKPVRNFKVMHCGDLDYHLKYTDRSRIDALYAQRGDCDEIILVKEGFITDTSVSNLIFFDGYQWFTPKKPLLNGTCRQRLLEEGSIFEAEIAVSDLRKYQSVKMISALRFPSEETTIPISGIFF